MIFMSSIYILTTEEPGIFLELTHQRNSSTTKSKIAATQSENYKRKNWGGGLGCKSMQETGAHPKTFKGHL